VLPLPLPPGGRCGVPYPYPCPYPPAAYRPAGMRAGTLFQPGMGSVNPVWNGSVDDETQPQPGRRRCVQVRVRVRVQVHRVCVPGRRRPCMHMCALRQATLDVISQPKVLVRVRVRVGVGVGVGVRVRLP